MHSNALRALSIFTLLHISPRLVVADDDDTSTQTTTRTSTVQTEWFFVTELSGSPITFTYTQPTATATFEYEATTTIETSAPPTETSKTIDATPLSTPLPSGEDMIWQGPAFESAIINSTNFFRNQHQAPPLKWDTSLASFAQDYAERCDLEHSSGPHGENLARGHASPALAIESWASEENKYNYVRRAFSEKAGHFTQLVWKDTTTVGCGAAKCGEGEEEGWMLVCEYDPPGNVKGDFGRNVGKAGVGVDGETGMGAARRIRGGGVWLVVALVAAWSIAVRFV